MQDSEVNDGMWHIIEKKETVSIQQRKVVTKPAYDEAEKTN